MTHLMLAYLVFVRISIQFRYWDAVAAGTLAMVRKRVLEWPCSWNYPSLRHGTATLQWKSLVPVSRSINVAQTLSIDLGVKTDPIEYRYTYPWLFRILADEGIHHLQLGSFFESYQLPDAYFTKLREQAAAYGVSITSCFTAHRELGGFYRCEPGWEAVARRNYERFIEVGALAGARSVGSNPGAVSRDRLETKAEGNACYLRNMKELMAYAFGKGLERLCIEPMSALSEPPTLPDEIRAMAEELTAYHHATPGTTPIGYCADVSHGYADRAGAVQFTHMELFEAAFPWLTELHLKNTDALFNGTFGFSEEERTRGIVDLRAVRDLLHKKAGTLPMDRLVAYLEIGGPKLGRDYSDHRLEAQLRASLAHVKEVFQEVPVPAVQRPPEIVSIAPVEIAPSAMCADLCRIEEAARELEALGADWLHLDIMDAAFTPNMPLGFEMFRQLHSRTRLAYDAHLMVNNPDFFVRQMAGLGARAVSIHVESATHLDRSLNLAHELGMKAGVALNPATPLSALDYAHHRLDFVLLMTVNPGFAGQRMVPNGIQKIADCRAYLDAHGLDIPIQVDGNVSFENIPDMVAAGADNLVAGTSSIFYPGASLAENFKRTRAAIAQGLRRRKTPV